MAPKHLALEEPASTRSAMRHARRRRRAEAPILPRAIEATFTALEESFFAAAPPETPAPGPEPDRFDDLLEPPDARRAPFAPWRRLLATIRAAFSR